MARIAIVGVGAIGSVIASLLQTSGQHQLILCTRRPLHGLTVTTPDGIVNIPTSSLTDPAQAPPVDWVMVATKTYDAAGAGAWLQALCKHGAPAAILQNGVEHRERFTPYLDPTQILPIIIDCPVEKKPDGTFNQRGTAFMKVEDTEQGRAFAALFHHTKADITLTADFLTAAWRKLCINSAGAITALTLKPAGVFHDEAIARLTLDLVAECAAVGAAEGAHLDPDIPQQVLSAYRAQPPDSVNSLLADRLAHRPMEIDARNGIIVRKALQHRIPTPCNTMTVALLNALAEQ